MVSDFPALQRLENPRNQAITYTGVSIQQFAELDTHSCIRQLSGRELPADREVGNFPQALNWMW